MKKEGKRRKGGREREESGGIPLLYPSRPSTCARGVILDSNDTGERLVHQKLTRVL